MTPTYLKVSGHIRGADRPVWVCSYYLSIPDHLWPERVDSILSVLYFIFNEGYSASSGGSLTRSELSDEAIRLARILVELAPAEPEACGLVQAGSG